MWDSLPSTALLNIYEHVDLKTKLSASATCKKWRDALFNPMGKNLQEILLIFCFPVRKYLIKTVVLNENYDDY